MTRNYLLPCTCGRKLTIEVSQAGGTVPCECGTRLAVPSMRQICELEHAPSDESQATIQIHAWSPQKGVIMLGLLIALLSAGVGVYLLATRPQPYTYDLASALEDLKKENDSLTPSETWYVWKIHILPHGLVELPHPSHGPLDARIAMHRRYVLASLLVAGLGLGMSTVAFLWKPRRTPAAG